MGGLVARWYVQREGGAEVTRKLITLGTPHRGAMSALEQLVNGVRKGPWPFRADLTEFVRSLPARGRPCASSETLRSAGDFHCHLAQDRQRVHEARYADGVVPLAA